jgi:peptide-methionine (S)-S-oxide reductase
MIDSPRHTHPLRRVGRALALSAVAAGATLLIALTAMHSATTRAAVISNDEPRVTPSATLDEPAGRTTPEVAVFAGGCFWGVQGVYQHVQGVLDAVSGYTGGSQPNAQYELVSTGTTGHAESVRVTYDPRRVSYATLLQIFFSVVHDPTELDRQGPDEGPQYRSAIFPLNAEQAHIAAAYIAQLNGAHVFSAPIVTRIEPGDTFYPAEAYHQNYLQYHPTFPYIAYNDMPKLSALQRLFPQRYRHDAVLVAVQASPSH